MKRILTEKNSIRLLWIGIILFFLGVIIFVWKETFSIEKISAFGDLIGGIIGSIWSLTGVILFYVALTEQRKDIQINRDALTAQVDALKQQIKEFELQRNELEETRKVFTEQSITLKNQRFENTFFQLLSLHHELIDKLNFNIREYGKMVNLEKREIITHAFNNLNSKINNLNYDIRHDSYGGIITTPKEPETVAIAISRLDEAYRSFYFDDYKQVLSHYFRNIYHVFKFIFKSKLIERHEKQFYASIVRAQLSSDELFLISYNSLQKGLGYPNFLFLIKEYDIMQNFDFGLIEKYKFHRIIFNDKIRNVEPEFNHKE